jgi:hypothetical protein
MTGIATGVYAEVCAIIVIQDGSRVSRSVRGQPVRHQLSIRAPRNRSKEKHQHKAPIARFHEALPTCVINDTPKIQAPADGESQGAEVMGWTLNRREVSSWQQGLALSRGRCSSAWGPGSTMPKPVPVAKSNNNCPRFAFKQEKYLMLRTVHQPGRGSGRGEDQVAIVVFWLTGLPGEDQVAIVVFGLTGLPSRTRGIGRASRSQPSGATPLL